MPSTRWWTICRLSQGIRWNQETKDADVTFVRPRPECSVVDGTCPTEGTHPFIPNEGNGFSDRIRFRNLSPKLGLQYGICR